MAGVEILSPGVRHLLEQPPGTNADGVIVERHRVSMANQGAIGGRTGRAWFAARRARRPRVHRKVVGAHWGVDDSIAGGVVGPP
ncbi:MAG: hypothetical protein QOE15_3049, partial [Acidimicrobiaceae bacterium]|jgi:hypothetical protein|nr:hypothetical protein [Acidimicrobiaceae bacterium]